MGLARPLTWWLVCLPASSGPLYAYVSGSGTAVDSQRINRHSAAERWTLR